MHFRYSVIEPYINNKELNLDKAKGILYDSGYDWPAAVFDESAENEIPGYLVFLDPKKLDEVLVLLDDLEGVNSGLFSRRLISTVSGVKSWSFEYAKSVEGFAEIESWEKY